jgi:hypothetical protein
MPSDSSTPAAALARRSFIAPLWHTFSFLLLLGFLAILDARHAHISGSSQPTAPHDAPLRAYLLPIFYEWGIAAWAWGGVLFKDGQLRELTGGRWTSWHNLAFCTALQTAFLCSSGKLEYGLDTTTNTTRLNRILFRTFWPN